MYLIFVGLVANNADPDQMLYSAASDLGLHCLFRSVYLSEYLREILYNNYGWYQQHICFMERFRVQTCYILRTKNEPEHDNARSWEYKSYSAIFCQVLELALMNLKFSTTGYTGFELISREAFFEMGVQMRHIERKQKHAVGIHKKCLSEAGGDFLWVPTMTAYFGSDLMSTHNMFSLT